MVSISGSAFITFNVNNAATGNALGSITVRITTSSGTVLEEVTNENGEITDLGPFVDGDTITIEVVENGFDDFSQELTVSDMESYAIALNPTVSNSFSSANFFG